MRVSNKRATRTMAVVLSLAMAVSGGIASPDSQAAKIKKPTVTKSITILEGESGKITVNKKSYKVKKVTATSKDSSIASIGKTKKTSVAVNGISEGSTIVTVKVKVYKKDKKGKNTKKTKTLTYKTTVNVTKKETTSPTPDVPSPTPSAPSQTQNPTKPVNGGSVSGDIFGVYVNNWSDGGAYPVGSTTVTFSVAASADPGVTLSYQWLRNGQPISGATGNTLGLSTAMATGSNVYYRCIVNGTKNGITISKETDDIPFYVGNDAAALPVKGSDFDISAGTSAGTKIVNKNPAVPLEFEILDAGSVGITGESDLTTLNNTTASQDDISTTGDGVTVSAGCVVFVRKAATNTKPASGFTTYTLTSGDIYSATSLTDLSTATVTVGALTYTGSTLTPTVTVSAGGDTLTVGADYELSYKRGASDITTADIKNAATDYKVVVTAKSGSAYSGSKEQTFTVSKASLSVALSPASDSVAANSPYTFTSPTVLFTGLQNGESLDVNTDYSVSFEISNADTTGLATGSISSGDSRTPTAAGTATITATITPSSTAKMNNYTLSNSTATFTLTVS